jgi:hypothetical protein
MHRERQNQSAEMEYSGARLAANVALIALAAAAAAFAATGLIGPAVAMAVIALFVYLIIYRNANPPLTTPAYVTFTLDVFNFCTILALFIICLYTNGRRPRISVKRCGRIFQRSWRLC